MHLGISTDSVEVTMQSETRFSPREFMRARRPERFSDSVTSETPILDRSELEYHLDSLTSRNQEGDFEVFSRALAEREICPNLLPHTGPTGGGDSKVDTETYPVAECLTLSWYEGMADAASQRWAFAFSAKRDWKPKLKADISKLVGTERGYMKAFFITNQFVPDRDRASVEKELGEKHGIDLRVLDRAWILDRVFRNKREELAINILRLSVTTATTSRKGPLDTEREADLSDIESRIRTVVEEGHIGPILVDLAIDAARISRSLELPRVETDGRFERAERLAREHGLLHQQIHAAYERAWAAYYWHEDFGELSSIYDRVEAMVRGSRNVQHLEWLSNLWMVLIAHTRRARLEREDSKLPERTAVLREELTRLSEEVDRPSTALESSQLLLMMDFTLAAPDVNTDALKQLRDLIRKAEGLVGFPMDPLVRIISELGEVLTDVPEYVELFETAVQVASSRQEQVTAGRLLVRRAEQLMSNEKPFEAIRVAGRALALLYKAESKEDLILALFMSGCAYAETGLLWAARGTLSMAASLATNDFWRYNEITGIQYICYRRMRWIELQLGRVLHSVAWHEVAAICGAIISQRRGQDANKAEEERSFNLALGAVLLRTPIDKMWTLERLPDILDRQGLNLAAICALYALGHPESFVQGAAAESLSEEEIREDFERWVSLPGAEELPKQPNFQEGRNVVLSSRVLGCSIEVQAQNDPPAIRLGEAFLASLESLLSTELVDGGIARESRLLVKIRKSDFAEQPFRLAITEDTGYPVLELACPSDPDDSTRVQDQGAFKEKLQETVLAALARVLLVNDGDLESRLKRLFGDDHGIERSVDFASGIDTVYNVLGNAPKFAISDWIESEDKTYNLRRASMWDADLPRTPQEVNHPEPIEFAAGDEDVPEELIDRSRVRHSDMQVFSLIREPLWDRAKWMGVGFLWDPNSYAQPPLLALIFRDQEAGKAIFRNWSSELGKVDEGGLLRIAIVRGVERAWPLAYRVIVATNPSATFVNDPSKYAIVISRVHTMHPKSPTNLEGFVRHYEAAGRYILSPAVWNDDNSEPEFLWDYGIGKSELHVRHAWEIGRHDPDASGMGGIEDPVIPSDVDDPPIKGLLEWLQSRASKSVST